MMTIAYLLGVVLLALNTNAKYVIQDDYKPSTFADQFNFFTAPDPTHGFVKYVDRTTAQNTGLYKVENGKVYIGVDKTNVAPNGRNSVRLESKKKYTRGLIIGDFQHVPGQACGTWPAFWTVGPNWPNSGEIDIYEGVNNGTRNAMTLHTSDGCTINRGTDFLGNVETTNCYINAPGQYSNQGCSFTANRDNAYGRAFNQAGGGVYATEWTSSFIKVWHFPRNAIPADIKSGQPNPAGWGKPMAKFAGGCNFDQKFANHQIVFNIAFCGDWAGNPDVWRNGCSQYGATCADYVRNKPKDFSDVFWLINSLKVYRNQ
ncbi:putative endo-1,3(4)-beta-glucanase [Aphelenchoides bicaudatus]|nr:putative endo-1,3(4)-beta-glucanase [Aphelenchoides bicaudatus]